MTTGSRVPVEPTSNAPDPSRWTRWTPGSLYGPARRALTPTVAGRSRTHHVALTLDDGPDPLSTPRFLDLLSERGTTATFFLVGERAARHPEVVEQIVAAGHELGVHGWSHRCVALVRPGDLAEQVRRARALLETVSGRPVGWYRPPFGIATVGSNQVAVASGLRPVLWTAWGRDWSSYASPASIVRTVRRTLRPGGTVLLHDTDAYSAPGSWQRTLAAAELLLDDWAARAIPVGPLAEHWEGGTSG